MKPRTAFYLNLGMTCLTMAVMLFSCSSCTTEELEQAQTAIQAVQVPVNAASTAMTGQPWYVLVMLGLDIASSVVATVIIHMKKLEAK